MNKDQFWEIIEKVNREASGGDDETHMSSAASALFQYSLEDIMDWHQIFQVYSGAANQQGLRDTCAAFGVFDSDDDFAHFRAWLISKGRESYMNVLREPSCLAELVRDDERPAYELFGYAAHYAYDAKLFHIDPTSGETLYSALGYGTRRLNADTERDIQAELPQGLEQAAQPSCAHSSSAADGLGAEAEQAEGLSPAPLITNLEELAERRDLAYGDVFLGDCQQASYVFQNTPENIANFIGRWPDARKITVHDPFDWLLVSASGWFIDNCPDAALRDEVQKTLGPIQLGEVEPQPFFCPTAEEVRQYERNHMEQNLQMGGLS